MGNLESLGEAVSGGMVARAVEPEAGEADGHTHESVCLNCGAALAGPYCQECGQKAHVHRTLTAFWHDLLHGVLHFEGKVWHTLPLLAWRPGELTRRYIDGQRAHFVSPIALFLFGVFLLFAIGGITGGFTTAIDQPAAQRELSGEIKQNDIKIAVIEKQRAAAARAGQSTADFDRKIAEIKRENATLRGLSTGDFVTDNARFQANDLPRWLRVPIENAARNPELLLYKIRTNAYKFSWALIPISVPFVWLLFPFSRRFRVYDHTVFVTYSLCFMSLLAVAAMLLGAFGLGSLAGLLVLVPPFHMYRQLKGAYGLTRFGALWRTVALTLFAFVAAGLFIAVVAGIGFAD